MRLFFDMSPVEIGSPFFSDNNRGERGGIQAHGRNRAVFMVPAYSSRAINSEFSLFMVGSEFSKLGGRG